MESEKQIAIMNRKGVFLAYLGKQPSRDLDKRRKEAIEKIYFFTDKEFDEICEDIAEEISRRKTKEKKPLEKFSSYTLKRNGVKEQLALTSDKELASLVEEILIVLMHKYPESPEDKIEFLERLSEKLSQLVENLTPKQSPAESVKNIESVRRAIEKEKDSLIRTEILVEALAASIKDASPQTEDLFDLVRRSIEDEKKQMRRISQIPKELYSALEAICALEGRKEYVDKIKTLEKLENKEEQQAVKAEITVAEFLSVSNKITASFPERKTKEKEKTLEEAVLRIKSIFEEIEFEITSALSSGTIEKHVSLLYQERPHLIHSLKAAQLRTDPLERLSHVPALAQEQDLFNAAKRFYTALLACLP